MIWAVHQCVWVCESVCPRTCRHIARRMMNGWLWNFACMSDGYHDANNVSNVGGDPVTQLNFKNVYKNCYAVLRAQRNIAVMRPLVLRLLLRDHAQTAAYGRPYQPKHSLSHHISALVFTWTRARENPSLAHLLLDAKPRIRRVNVYSNSLHIDFDWK